MGTIRFNTGRASTRPRPGRAVLYYLGHVFIYLGLLLIALVLMWLGQRLSRMVTAYEAAVQEMAVLESLSGEQVALILLEKNDNTLGFEESVRLLAESLAALDEAAQPFLPMAPYLGWVPVYGGDLQAAPALLAAGRDVSRSGIILLDALSPLFQPGSQPDQAELLPAVVDHLARAETDLLRAEHLLRQRQADLAGLDVERLTPSLAGQVDRLQRYLPQAVTGLQLARSLPALLGSASPQAYLILTQNSDELRPSGGYINAAGRAVFDRGALAEFVMQDSYAVDRISEVYPYPPDPLYQYMAADYWLLRDAGWSPDFPTAARTAGELYRLGQDVSTHGVIALDQHALAYLLAAFEPLPVEGETVTAGNVIRLMRQHWAPENGQGLDQEWWRQRKSFMLALAEAIRQKFEHDPAGVNLPVLRQALVRALAEKHLMIYLEDPTWANFLARQNWTGALADGPGDYLMVVEANVGFNKASAILQRQLRHAVVLAPDGSAQVQTSLVYQHPAPRQVAECRPEMRYSPVYEQNMAGCSWNYLRLVVPAGAQLLRGPQIVVPGRSLLRGQSTTGEIDQVLLGAGKMSWGQLSLLAPQNTMRLNYTYRLPAGAARRAANQWQYRLYLQKQPGTIGLDTEVVVTLPDGGRLLQSRPAPAGQEGGTITYRADLTTDQVIDLSYTVP